jgi:pre-mRNA-splicing factor 38A
MPRSTLGWQLKHVDEFIDELLTGDYSCDVALPHLPKRHLLEDQGMLQPRVSALEELDDDEELEQALEEEDEGEEEEEGAEVEAPQDGEDEAQGNGRKRERSSRDRDEKEWREERDRVSPGTAT